MNNNLNPQSDNIRKTSSSKPSSNSNDKLPRLDQ